jgi:tetratricopeptide (TPR) repeat protein
MVHRFEGRYEEALADLDRALAVDPEYVRAHAERSLCLIGLERWGEALRDMARAADLDRESHWHRVRFAMMLLDLGRHAEALREVNRALADPDEHGTLDLAWPYTVRAWALHGLGHESEALADLERAISVDDSFTLSHATRGWLLWEAGQLDQAEQDFGRALADEPVWPWAYGGRGAVRLYAERYEDAIDDFTQAFTIQFGMADAENQVARPLVELLRQHLPANRAAITAAIRLGALLTHQQQWPGVTRQAASVLALRPSLGLLTGSARILARVTTALDDPLEGADSQRITWTRKLLPPILHALAPWRSPTPRDPG